MNQTDLTPNQRAAQAASYDSAAADMRAQAKDTRTGALPFGHPDAAVVNTQLQNIALAFENLATYFAGKAHGLRQEI